MRYISLILFLVCMTVAAQAQTYSYVYIQGDKQVPFYVKLEGDMLPRYGKNYCIIPKLEAGTINIDILFQQNAYPAQHFVIQVPEHGYRGFYLTKKNNEFSLFDLQQQFYLPAGNTAEADHAPDKNVAEAPPVAVTATPEPIAVQQPAEPVKTENKPVEQTLSKPPVVKETPQPVKTEPTVPGQPKFIEDIQLDNDHIVKPAGKPTDSVIKPTVTDTAAPAKNTAPDTTTPAQSNTAPVKTEVITNSITSYDADGKEVMNSDCPAPLADDQFEAIYKKALQQNEEESRLSYLNEQLGNCYTTAQAGILAKSMDTDAARYTFLKKIYPRITDQSKFVSLQNLLGTEQWRGHFMEIVNH